MLHNRLKYLTQQVSEKDDEHSFDELFRYFFPGMLSYAKILVHDEDVAKDLIQDIFLKLWVNRNTLMSITNLSGYLYISLRHNAVHYLQAQKRSRALDTEEHGEFFSFKISDPEILAIQKEDISRIEATINSLPHKCRMVFRLVKEEGLKYKEVAGLLDISVKTVEAHMTFAYSRIVECFEEIFPASTIARFKRKNSG